VVTVIGSPTCTLFGLASVAMVKLPIAPEKLGGAFCWQRLYFKRHRVTANLECRDVRLTVQMDSRKKGSERDRRDRTDRRANATRGAFSPSRNNHLRLCFDGPDFKFACSRCGNRGLKRHYFERSALMVFQIL